MLSKVGTFLQITQQLESSVANQFTQFQHGFVANYTANHTEAMRQVNDTIKHGVQAAVADAVQEVRTRIAEDVSTQCCLSNDSLDNNL